MGRLSKLAPEDQPQTFAADGSRMPDGAIPKMTGAPMAGQSPPQGPGVNGAPVGPAGMPDFQQGDDPLAPQGYQQPPALDDEVLAAEPITDEEAGHIAGLEESLGELLKDDTEPEPPDDSVLKMEDDALLTLFESRLQKASAFREHFETRWLAAWLNYNQILQGESASWKSKVFLPLVFQQVTAALPPMVAAIYDSGPVWEARPLKPEHAPRAKAVTALLDWYMRDKTPASRRLRDLLWYSTLFGTGFLRVTWRTTIGTKRQMVPVHAMGEQPGTKGDFLSTRLKVTPGQVVEDVPRLENIDIWDAWPAPHTRDDDYYPYFIERVELPIEELRAMGKTDFLGPDGERRVEEWLKSRPEESEQDVGTYATATKKASAWRQVGMGSSIELSAIPDEDRSKSAVVIFIMWTDEYVLTVSGDGTKVLGVAPNPYWFKKVPIIVHHFERIPGCIFGRGIGDIIEGMQAQANFNYNKGNDAIQLALNAPIAVRQAGNALVQGQVAWQPGALIPCRDPGSDIKPLVVPDPMNAVFRLEDHLMTHADRSTGINDISRGQSPQGANTATEFAGLQSQVRIRLSQHVREIRTTLGRIGSILLKLVQQFVDQPTAIRVTGKRGLDFIEVTPEDVVQEYDLVPAANSVRSNPALLRSDVVALMPVMQASPFVKQEEWMAYVLRTFEVPEPERMLQQPMPPPRDPRAEERVLGLGIEIDPSPDEDFQQHMMMHSLALQQTDPNSPAYAARRKHMEDTMTLQSQVMMAQQGALGPDGQPQQGGAPGGGGTEARRGATQLGNAAGATGPGGHRSPGPSGPPGRKNP